MRKTRICAAFCAVLLVLTGCGRTDSALVPDPVTSLVRVGYTSSSPDYVLAKLMVAMLKLKGVPSRVDRIESPREGDIRNVGPALTRASSAVHRAKLEAVANGVVDLVPEYTGQLLYAMNPDAPILRADLQADPDTAEGEYGAIFAEMTRSLPNTVRSTRPAQANRAVVVAVQRKDPRLRSVRTVSQLSKKCGEFALTQLTYPADAEELSLWSKRWRQVYGCQPRSITTTGRVNASTIMTTFGTSPALLDDQWRILIDDQHAIPSAHVFALVAGDALNRPRQLIIDQLTDVLTTSDVAELQQVEWENPDQLDAYIANWLRAHGLLTSPLLHE